MKILSAVLGLLHEDREVDNEVNGHIFVTLVTNTLNFWDMIQE
jgi:hypothetical protein